MKQSEELFKSGTMVFYLQSRTCSYVLAHMLTVNIYYKLQGKLLRKIKCPIFCACLMAQMLVNCISQRLWKRIKDGAQRGQSGQIHSMKFGLKKREKSGRNKQTLDPNSFSISPAKQIMYNFLSCKTSANVQQCKLSCLNMGARKSEGFLAFLLSFSF